MSKSYTIQIRQSAAVSKTVKADSIQSALEIAQDLAELAYTARGEVVKPARGWATEWHEEAEVVAVFGY